MVTPDFVPHNKFHLGSWLIEKDNPSWYYFYPKRDLKNFYSKIKIGGLISGHDYNLPGISEGIEEFRKEMNINTTLRFCSNNVWYWNKE